MTRHQLEHAIRAACDVAGDTEVIVFGSQAILGEYPDAPASLRTSIEVDVQPKNLPANTDLVDGALGELSQFHATHGFYVHGVTIDSAILPSGWTGRTVAVSDRRATQGNTDHCLEAHDLALSKLVANRPKDRVFVTTLLRENLISGDILLGRAEELPVDVDRRKAIADWIHITMADVGS